MWAKPTNADWKKLPKLYSTEDVKTKDKIIQWHFFLGGCDWYIVEGDQEKGTLFGFAIINSDTENAEWGYVNYRELEEVKAGFMEVDFDKHWTKKKASEVDKIVACRNGILKR